MSRGAGRGFLDRHTEWGNRFVWASFLPALAGVFIGAPLFAREFEHGTWRLAVTQGVTRTRWFTTKIALVGTGVAGVAGLCAALFTWWRTPLVSRVINSLTLITGAVFGGCDFNM
ncbi:MAG: hypothetical protein ACRDSK_31370 [Actinophytocola sp.]|uniref:hypothetical protein n=1 Tax=Actinophytocola sp. TaxID=1872138 RepID=UPI003D6B7804